MSENATGHGQSYPQVYSGPHALARFHNSIIKHVLGLGGY